MDVTKEMIAAARSKMKPFSPANDETLALAIEAALAAAPAPAVPVKQLDADEETYQIGVRDGYSQAVQQIDQLTGGDGEYRYCTDHDPDRHTPDPATMIQRIVDRFETLNLIDDAAKTGRDQEWGISTPPAPAVANRWEGAELDAAEAALTEAEARLKLAVEALERIDRHYDSPDLTHVDFRVEAATIARAALASIKGGEDA